jgi:hypothetical protein
MLKPGYYGFSWTYFFFGPFVPLFRGDFEEATSQILVAILSLWIWMIVESFLYNKHYMTRMLTEKGWVLSGTEGENQNARRALGFEGN